MSALGDIPLTESGLLQEKNNGKIHNVAIPLCVIHAFDDPLITWKTVARNEGLMHPDNLSRTGSGNLILLLTKGGGHVGWPVGFLPFVEKWGWMTNAASSFAQAVDQAKKLSIAK
jgi:predicted alpha/beta-fold hydrolase